MLGGEEQKKRSIASNRKAFHDYVVRSELEVGIALKGPEVKSIRAGHVNLNGAYAHLNAKGIPELVGMYVGPYREASLQNKEPKRPRALLLRKREVAEWKRQLQEKRMTLVPLELYFKGDWVKVRIGVCQGKKAHDKREALKERDANREMQRVERQKNGR